MTLMKCPECGKENLNTSAFCGHCGKKLLKATDDDISTDVVEVASSEKKIMSFVAPQTLAAKPRPKRRVAPTPRMHSSYQETSPSLNSNQAKCPKCGSTSLAVNQNGFGFGKAAVGAALVGPIGLLAGGIGAKKTMVTCMNCGYKYTL